MVVVVVVIFVLSFLMPIIYISYTDVYYNILTSQGPAVITSFSYFFRNFHYLKSNIFYSSHFAKCNNFFLGGGYFLNKSPNQIINKLKYAPENIFIYLIPTL